MSKSRVIENRVSADRGNLLDRKAADRLAGSAKRGREFLDVVVRRNVLGLEMDLGHSPIFTGDQAVEDLREPDTRLDRSVP